MALFYYYVAMICFPNCKINIGLYITNRRQDGYHDLETVFYPIKGLHDALEAVTTGEAPSLQVHGNHIEGPAGQNLVCKAYELVRQRFPAKVPNLQMHLLKAIPTGAGLGGGSSDGAFMLGLLNDLCRLELTDEALAAMALELGSDCPFFIYNSPQYATGRGEQMLPLPLLDLSAYSIQLVCPEIHVSTREAFSMITPRKAMFDLKKLPGLHISQWKEQVHNDFEDAVFMRHPRLAAIKQQLYEQGAIYASMSGSGSTIYGIFEKGAKAAVRTDLPFREYTA